MRVEPPKTLCDLAFACWVFGSVLDFDKSYRRLLEAVDSALDLDNSEHRRALLKWLNEWGCHQFARKDHSRAAREVLSWHNEFGDALPRAGRHLWQLDDAEVTAAVDAYAELSSRIASLRAGRLPVRFGPVGAAKVLFALRPRAFPPWDAPIQHEFGYDGSPESYRRFLQHVVAVLRNLAPACRQNGFDLPELPARLDRELATPVKVIDEYYWVTITRRCKLPPPEVVEEWLKWAKSKEPPHV